MRGELDEALCIYLEEQLPVFERLGDVYSSLICKTNIGILLINRQQFGDIDQALVLLHEARDVAEKMGFPEANKIDAIIESVERPQALCKPQSNRSHQRKSKR